MKCVLSAKVFSRVVEVIPVTVYNPVKEQKKNKTLWTKVREERENGKWENVPIGCEVA